MPDIVIPITDEEDAIATAEAARLGLADTTSLFAAQAQTDLAALKVKQWNEWWRDLPDEDADPAVVTKKVIYDANQE